MKTYIYGSIMMLSLVVYGQQTLAEIVKIGYFQLPPLQYVDEATQMPQGASRIYFDAMAAQLGYEVEWVGPLPLLRLFEQLKNGELDGSLGFVKTPESERFLYYLDTPLYFAQPTLIVRHENPLSEIRSIEDIRGYRIGTIVTASGHYTPLIDDHRDLLTIEALGGEQWLEQNLKKLITGRVDAVFDRQPYTPQFIAAQLHLDTQVRLLPLPETATPMYIVFAKASKYGITLVEQCNALLPRFDLDYGALAKQELQAVNEGK